MTVMDFSILSDFVTSHWSKNCNIDLELVLERNSGLAVELQLGCYSYDYRYAFYAFGTHKYGSEILFVNTRFDYVMRVIGKEADTGNGFKK